MKNTLKTAEARRRREIKSRITILTNQNTELLKMWAYNKSLDENFLKNQARNNLVELEKLENEYDVLAPQKKMRGSGVSDD